MTAEAVAKTAGYSREIIVEPSLYHATPNDVLAVLCGVHIDAHTVLIVGHNPGLEEFVQRLTGERHDLPTAALVQIELAINEWSAVSASPGSIVNTWRPRD